MHETATKLLENKLPAFLETYRDEIFDATDFRGDLIVSVKPEKIREMIVALKNNAAFPFNMMIDLFGMDYMKTEPLTPERFAVIYNLYSMVGKRRVQIKAYVPEATPTIDSIHDIYKAANWFERETWDMFGIVFKGHPHLIRILTHHDFVGHPMRKDYPSDKYQRLKSAIHSNEM